MVRNKVKLAWIENDGSRKRTYKKRKNGLVDKVRELSTLCGVEAMAIVMSPFDSEPTAIWPSVQSVHQTVLKYMSFSETEQAKKKLDLNAYYKQKIEKLNQHMKRTLMDAHEYMVMQCMDQILQGNTRLIDDLTIKDLNVMNRKIDADSRMVKERINRIQASGKNNVMKQLPNANNDQLSVQSTPESEKCALGETMEALQSEQWFMEGMNPQHEHMGYFVGAEMGPDYPDIGSPWFDPSLFASTPSGM